MRALQAPMTADRRVARNAAACVPTADLMTPEAEDRQLVLLVDDEPRVLRGLKRLLRDDRWELTATSDTDVALRTVADQPVDIVVADYRMPAMDGVTLLERVREERPETVRVVLSGEIDPAHVARSTAVAHQWLTKPCEPRMLVAALERSRRLRGMLGHAELRRLIGTLGQLPSSPAVWTRLQARLDDDDASAADIAAIVGTDVALTTKVLQLVNSAFMGLSRRVTSVADAVAYIGLETLRNLVVSAELQRTFPLASSGGDFSLPAMTAHGQACSQLTLRLVEDRATRDHATAAAMLQDVGQLIHASCDPGGFAGLLREARTRQVSLHDVERDANGFSHAAVGAYLLTLWGLPTEVIDAVAAHHVPRDGPPPERLDATAAVRAAHLAVQRSAARAADPTDRAAPDDIDAELGRILGPARAERWLRRAELTDERAERS